jgi:fatty acid amide hydrolase 2
MAMRSLTYWFLVFVHEFGRLIVSLTHPIFRWLYDGEHRGLPPVDSPLLMKSAVELAAMIRKREVTSLEVVEAFIKRIGQVNKYINAVVANRFEDARKEAAEVDHVLDSGNVPDNLSLENAPFLGVPITTKEAISIAGLPNTSGLLIRRGILSPEDADVIKCMRHAGAIPLALSNVSELCMWYESSNFIYGRSNNAYHQGRMVGGSSGGEGCVQSAAASPMGIGSDIGGSIRMPCFFNGVFGHKPSTGVVSNAGQFPLAKGEAETFLGTGPICRYATDLLPMFKLLVRSEHKEKLRLDETVDVRKLKYYYMEDDGGGFLMSPVHPDIKAAVRKAAKHFESLGCTVKRVSLRQMRMSFAMWSSLMGTSGNDSFCSLLANGPPNTPVNPFLELLLWLVGRGRHTLPAIGLGIGEKARYTPEKDAELRRLRDGLREEFEALLGNDGVFFYPPHPLPAPYHNQPLLVLFNFAYTSVFNVLGFPVTAVPMGLAAKEGVPVGIQVVGSRYQDRLTLAVAAELEHAGGGWVPPFTVSK